MHPKFASLVLAASPAAAYVAGRQSSSSYTWSAPSASDRRSPCPMVNTLANHGYLARDGLNISMADLVFAFNASVNLASAATELVGAKALLTSTTGNNDTFNLDDLDTHGVIEHDGSLSRNDVFFGDNHSFNKTIWDATAAHFTNSTISIATAATARKERLAAAAAANPEFNMTSSDVTNSFIESALYLSVFGNLQTGDANTEFVKIFFQQERLPIEEGWTRSTDQITITGILAMVSAISAAS